MTRIFQIRIRKRIATGQPEKSNRNPILDGIRLTYTSFFVMECLNNCNKYIFVAAAVGLQIPFRKAVSTFYSLFSNDFES